MKNLFILVFLAIGFTTSAQIPIYYNDVDLSLSGSSLKEELSNKIKRTHTKELTYSEVWSALKQTDLDPTNINNVLLIYGYDDTDGNYITDRSRSKNMNGGDQGDWNREHSYPKSKGQPNLGTSGPGADAHHLRSSDVRMNGDRGSLPYDDGSGTAKRINNSWYPGDEWKGDVARMMMYMYLRYDERCNINRVGSGPSSYHADIPNIFLEWNEEDPVNDFELNRNNILEELQGNRNPFIDNPNFATQIWSGPVAEDKFGGGCTVTNVQTETTCDGTNTIVTITFNSSDTSAMYEYSLNNGEYQGINSGDQIVIPGSTIDEVYKLKIRDTNDLTCIAQREINVVACPIVCSISLVESPIVECNNAGTIPDPSDDYITVTLNLETNTTSTTYSVSSEDGYVLSATTGTYSQPLAIQIENGSAIVGDFNLTITDTNDANCTKELFIKNTGSCSEDVVTNSAGILITEIADPKTYTNRFIEICNRGNDIVDISNYAIQRYANGKNNFDARISVPENTTVAPGECFVFTTNGFTGGNLNCNSISSDAISGNGDDVYELVDANSNTIDLFGVVGVDGTGEAWEYKDAIAIRGGGFKQGNNTWLANEWTFTRGATYANDATPCNDEKACTVSLVDTPIVNCNNAGTTSDNTDDFITVSLNLNTTTRSTNYEVSSPDGYTLSATTGTYNQPLEIQLQNGSATVGDFNLIITDTEDESCTTEVTIVNTGACSNPENNILITEVADPKSYTNRFVEICNRGGDSKDISGYKINRYANGKTTTATIQAPEGTVLASGECFVFTTNQFSGGTITCNSVSSNTISGNGDDVYELVDANSKTIDIFGEVGIDGTGTAWEYKDAIASRKGNIKVGNTTWEESEWTFIRDATYENDATPCKDENLLSIYDDLKDTCVENSTGTNVSGTEFQYILVDGKVIAAINSNGHDLGLVTSSVFLSSEIRVENEAPFMNRTIYLSPSKPLEGDANATIRYYFTDEEFEALKSYTLTTTDGGDDIDALVDLGLLKVSGVSCSTNARIIAKGMSSDKVKAVSISNTNKDSIGNYLEFEVTEFSSFTAGTNIATLLPIEYINFDAQLSNETVLINWSTLSEVNLEKLRLQHSQDGKQWQTIKTFTSNGDSNYKKDYSFIHKNVNSGMHYYRLEQSDLDGSVVYSKIVSIDKPSEDFKIVSINAKNLQIQTEKNSTVTLEIYSVNGNVQHYEVLSLTTGNTNTPLNLQRGVYILRIKNKSNNITKKFLIH